MKKHTLQRLAAGFMAATACSLLIAATDAPAICQKLVVSQCHSGSLGGECSAKSSGTGRHNNAGTVTDVGLRDACNTAYVGEAGSARCSRMTADNFCRYTCSPVSTTCTTCGATVSSGLRPGPVNDAVGGDGCSGTVPNPYE